MKLLHLAIPPWAKLVGYGVVALCLLWMFLVVKSWHDDSKALPGVKQELTDSRAETKRVRSDLTAEAGRIAKVNEGLSRENESLRQQRADIPVRPVRLCVASAKAAPIAGDPSATGRGDAATAGAGVLSQEARPDLTAGPDIGPQLYSIADEADEVLRRYRGAQAYIAGLPESCTVAR